MNQKCLLYYPIFRDINSETSVNKKLTEMINAFKNLSIELDIISYSTQGIYFNEKLIQPFSKNKYVRRLQHFIYYQSINLEVQKNRYNLVWLRAGYLNPWFFNFVKTSKRHSKHVVIEYGTFPFDKEVTNWFEKSWYVTNEFYKLKLKNYVDAVITYCGQDFIYKIPCIKMGNGIEQNIILTAVQKKQEAPLQFISVSSIYYWHGIDRLIEGLNNYYNQPHSKIVELSIVGEGSESENLKNLVSKYKLEKYVSFLGQKTKYELAALYQNAHMGIGSLAPHRKSILEESTLKSREYFASGLPIVLAARDRDFETMSDFVYQTTLDETPLNINELVLFYNKLRKQNPSFAEDILHFTKENLTWESKIKSVFNHFNQHSN
jgi:glycosyltransferase involved in cell wall biosynthesis